MIIEDNHYFDIRRHKIEHNDRIRNDYIVYSHVTENPMNGEITEDVLMIYSNIANKRIFFDQRFLSLEAGGDGVNIDKFIKEPGVINNIAVMGYNRGEFEEKYFVVLL